MRLLWGLLPLPLLRAAASHNLTHSPCATLTLHQLQDQGALALKFPSPTALTDCLSTQPANKFCYLKQHLPITPTVSASTSASLCLPNTCKAADIQTFLDQLCHVPTCDTLAFLPSLQALCAAVQPIHCDPHDRARPRDDAIVSLHCVEAEEYNPDIIIEDDSVYNADPIVIQEERRLQSSVNETRDVQLSANEMDALVLCGSSTFRNWETLLFSGGMQDLGDYETCISDPHRRYCVTKFYALLTSGRCLPESCDEQTLAHLLDFICTRVGTSAHAMHSCLDFVDVIPLDLCVSVQLLGCSRAIEMSVVNSITGSFSLDDLFAAPKSGPFQAQYSSAETLTPNELLKVTSQAVNAALSSIRKLRPDVMDSTPPTSTIVHGDTDTELTLFPRLARLSQEALEDGFFGAVAAKSYKVVCDLSGPSKSDPDFAIAVSLMSLFFVVFPLLGLFGRPLKRDTETETETASSTPLQRWIHHSPVARFFAAFSVRNNYIKMDRSRHTLLHGPFNHLCGMRVASLLWVVAGHTFSFLFLGGVLSNMSELQSFFQRYTFQVVFSAQLSVDSFFFFSGFLLSVYGTNRIYKELSKIRSKSLLPKCLKIATLFLFVVIKRFVRLVPTMLFVLGMSYWGVPYLGSGPNWPALQQFLRYGVRGGCRRWWWASALMINNLVPEADQMECFGQGWYLANDFQFFIVGTLLIMLGYLGVRYLRIASGVLFVASLSVTWYIAWKYNLSSGMAGISGLPGDAEQSSLLNSTGEMMSRYYNKPWCRIGPYLIGLVCGSLYREGDLARWLMKEQSAVLPSGKESVSSRREVDGVLVALGHILAMGIMFCLVYALPYNENAKGSDPWNRYVDVTYFATSRSVWAMCVGWFTLVMAFCPLHPAEEENEKETVHDNDKILIDDAWTITAKRLLSGSTLCFLALLTYAAYLVHPIIQHIYYASSPTASYMSEMGGWFETLFHGVLALSVAFALYLMVETVMANLFAFVGL